jgi:hypothetical protein
VLKMFRCRHVTLLVGAWHSAMNPQTLYVLSPPAEAGIRVTVGPSASEFTPGVASVQSGAPRPKRRSCYDLRNR